MPQSKKDFAWSLAWFRLLPLKSFLQSFLVSSCEIFLFNFGCWGTWFWSTEGTKVWMNYIPKVAFPFSCELYLKVTQKCYSIQCYSIKNEFVIFDNIEIAFFIVHQKGGFALVLLGWFYFWVNFMGLQVQIICWIFVFLHYFLQFYVVPRTFKENFKINSEMESSQQCQSNSSYVMNNEKSLYQKRSTKYYRIWITAAE